MINKSIIPIIFISVISSCTTQTGSDNNHTIQDSVGILNSADINKNVTNTEQQSNKIWDFDYEKDFPVKLKQVDPDTLTPEKLIAILNSTQITLEIYKLSNDTIYVKIKDSNYLTQNMGSTGAFGFMSTATYTLTELKNINHVNFDFQEGDHAAPGTYSRKYFEDLHKSNNH